MPTENLQCPGCKQFYSQHWCCAVCRHFGHANVIARYDPAICRDCEDMLKRRNARRCKRCEAVKALDAFPGGRGRICRACKLAHDQAVRAINPEHALDQARTYYARHRELRLARTRQWRAANPERVRAWRKRSYQRHGHTARMRSQRRYAERREHLRAQNRARRQADPARYAAQRREREVRKLIAILRGEATP